MGAWWVERSDVSNDGGHGVGGKERNGESYRSQVPVILWKIAMLIPVALYCENFLTFLCLAGSGQRGFSSFVFFVALEDGSRVRRVRRVLRAEQ